MSSWLLQQSWPNMLPLGTIGGGCELGFASLERVSGLGLYTGRATQAPWQVTKPGLSLWQLELQGSCGYHNTRSHHLRPTFLLGRREERMEKCDTWKRVHD